MTVHYCINLYMRFHSYLNSAVQILNVYDGQEPFASFLKKYFAANKKHGSTDRKRIGHLCYCYFRMGKAGVDMPIQERILIALFLCSRESNEILMNLKPEWDKLSGLPPDQKLSVIHYAQLVHEIFPWKNELSEGINYNQFSESFLTQPDLFLRIRPGKEKQVVSKLINSGISFEQLSESSIALPNASKVEDIVEINKEAIIQDYNSQKIGKFYFKRQTRNIQYQILCLGLLCRKWW